tara:strand:+ start:90 stop:221 length:132 start_codon:yes stop_codon:yes gene_type:complete
MKKPNKDKLDRMYGKNESKKKAYLKGWDTVGKVLKASRKREKK